MNESERRVTLKDSFEWNFLDFRHQGWCDIIIQNEGSFYWFPKQLTPFNLFASGDKSLVTNHGFLADFLPTKKRASTKLICWRHPPHPKWDTAPTGTRPSSSLAASAVTTKDSRPWSMMVSFLQTPYRLVQQNIKNWRYVYNIYIHTRNFGMDTIGNDPEIASLLVMHDPIMLPAFHYFPKIIL